MRYQYRCNGKYDMSRQKPIAYEYNACNEDMFWYGYFTIKWLMPLLIHELYHTIADNLVEFHIRMCFLKIEEQL